MRGEAPADFRDLGEHPFGPPVCNAAGIAVRPPGPRCPKCRRSRKPHVSRQFLMMRSGKCMRCRVRWTTSEQRECLVCGALHTRNAVCERCSLLFGDFPKRKLGSMRRQLRTTLRAFDEVGIPEEKRIEVLRARRALAGPIEESAEVQALKPIFGSFTFIPSVPYPTSSLLPGAELLKIERI